MYKILPMLLFAFLFAEDNQEPHFIQSDSLDFVWAEKKLDLLINEFHKEFDNFIKYYNFFIDAETKIYDVMRIDTLYSDIVSTKHLEMHAKYSNEKVHSMSILSNEDFGHWRIVVFTINIEVNVDKSMGLRFSTIQLIVDKINMILVDLTQSIINDRGYGENYSDNIKFNFLDSEEIKSLNNNKQLSLNRDDIYDESWAVIIGIDKYKYSDQLNYAVKDAEAVKDMLISKFDYPEENIRYLIDKEATLSNIKLNLGEVAVSAEENDRILVFYSGHGETLIGADKSEKGYIIPFEGKQDNPYATGIAMDEILTTSQISKSKHMLFLMDACYSGLMTEHVKGLAKPQEEGYLAKVANEQARQIITAGGNEPAIEGGRWNHSVFTKNLLDGLDDWEADIDSDGYITADELGTYLRKSVTEDSNNMQTPQKGRFINSGTGEFVFFSDAAITMPSPKMDQADEIVYGCMDEAANNYNPNATNPDRSCQYGRLVTSLEFGEIKKINEIKVMGTDIKSRLEAILPGGKTGEKYVDGYFEVPVIINNNSDIAGFQIEILGGNIIDASGGIAEENGFMTSISEPHILSFSLVGDVLSRGGNQVLLDLKIEPTETEICLQNIILSDLNGKQMQSTSFDCFKP